MKLMFKKRGRDDMTLHQLVCVTEVARFGSISKAAEYLHISQPTVSGIIKDLEAEYSIRIFLRSSKGITVTPEGGEFLSHAQLILSHVDVMENIYHIPKQISILKLSTGKIPFVHQTVAEFYNYYASGDFETPSEKETMSIFEGLSIDVVNDILIRKSDIGVILTSDISDSVWRAYMDAKGVDYHFLTRSKPHIIMRKDHPLAKHNSLKERDIQDYPVIYPNEPQKDIPNNNEGISLYNLNHLKKVVFMYNLHTTLNFVLKTNALYISTSGFGINSKHESLLAVPYVLPSDWNFYWVKLKGKSLSPTEKHFVDILSENALQ